MISQSNIVLIGLRGSGKTTVGALLGQHLHRRFVDLDSVSLNFIGASSVCEAWQTHGEQTWRDAENRALTQVLHAENQVIALGGGTPTIPEAAALLRQHQEQGRILVVHLHCDLQALKRRLLAQPGDRPSLSGLTLEAEIESIALKRLPIFRALCQHEIDSTDLNPQQTAAALIELFS